MFKNTLKKNAVDLSSDNLPCKSILETVAVRQIIMGLCLHVKLTFDLMMCYLPISLTLDTPEEARHLATSVL